MAGSAKRKKTVMVITAWVLFMLAFSTILFFVTKRSRSGKVQRELLFRADVIAEQIPTLLENSFYSQITFARKQSARTKALDFALKNVEEIDEARELLDDFVQDAGFEGLAVYDLDGNLLYNSGNDESVIIEPELFEFYRDYDAGSVFDSLEADPETLRDYYFSSDTYDVMEDLEASEDETEAISWKVKDGQWILITSSTGSLGQMTMREFDWRWAVQRLDLGEDGALFAVDKVTGKVLTCPEMMTGQDVQALDIRVEEDGSAASLEKLTEVFSEPEQVATVSVEGRDFYTARLKVDDVLMLVMAPVESFRDILGGSMSLRVLLLLLMTGICILYVCFHLQDPEEALLCRLGRFVWNKTLSGRLTACTVLLAAATLGIGLFLEILFLHGDAFFYCQDKAIDAAGLYVNSLMARMELRDWFEEELLARCRIARTILDHTEQEDVTWDYLEELSESLNIMSVYVFDEEGRITATNSPYDSITVTRSDPFHALLEGRSEMTGILDLEDVSDDELDRVGVSRHDRDHVCTGLIMIVDDAREINVILENLGLETAFERLCLEEGSRVLALSGKDQTIRYHAEVEDGVYAASLDSLDYTGLKGEVIGLDAEKLQDDYSGNISMLNRKWFVAAQLVNGEIFLVMKPGVRLEIGNFVKAAGLTFILLIFIAIISVISCLGKDADYVPEEPEPDRLQENNDADSSRSAREKRQEELRFVFGGIVNTKKPNFKDRWPRDVTRWKDKNPDEKFYLILKLVLIAVFAAVFFNAKLAGEYSYWYYVFNGKWDAGVNLHTVSSCLIYICMLLLLKTVIHKILFLVAKVVNSRGETICQLLDSASGYILTIAGIFICLAKFGLKPATLSLTAGVAGVVFSFSCQRIIADILAGILIVVEGIVRVGDMLIFRDNLYTVLSIGIRSTQLKRGSEVTVVHNDDFKDFALKRNNEEGMVFTELSIDLRESLENVEEILHEELPVIHEKLCAKYGISVTGPNYQGVKNITENGVVLSFITFCQGTFVFPVQLEMNRALKLMCENHGIMISMPQVVVHETEDLHKPDE